MFKLQEFKADLFKRGTVSNHNFMVNMTVPEYLRGQYKAERISIRCEATNLPGISLASLDGPPRYGYGPIESVPYNVIYDQIPLTFIMDRDSEVHKFFYDWMNCIVNFGRSSTSGSLSEVTNRNGAQFRTYEVGYKDKYAVDTSIQVFNEQHRKIIEAKMFKSYPKSVTPIDLGWDQTDSIMKLQVSFTFREYSYEYFKHSVSDKSPTQ